MIAAWEKMLLNTPGVVAADVWVDPDNPSMVHASVALGGTYRVSEIPGDPSVVAQGPRPSGAGEGQRDPDGGE